jgi:hypothetical protein
VQTFRDSHALRTAPEKVPALSEHLAWLIAEVSKEVTSELDQLITIVVAEPGDNLKAVEDAVGFDLRDEHPENVSRLPGWFELTFIVNGEGFGYIVYVPDHQDMAPALLAYCRSHLPMD